MRAYEVIIDRSSTHIDIAAESEEEAKELGWQLYKKECRNDFEDWVAEVNDSKLYE